MKKYLYLFLLGLFLLSSCSNNEKNLNQSENCENTELSKSVNNVELPTEIEPDISIFKKVSEDEYEDSNSVSMDYEVDSNYIKNVWREERYKKSVVFDTEVSIPEDWIALDSTSGSFYTDNRRIIFIYMDVADGINDIPVELNIGGDIDKFCKEADKHFIKSLELFTRGEFDGNLRVDFLNDNNIKVKSQNNIGKNIQTVKTDFGEYYLREGVLSDDKTEHHIISAFINTHEKDNERPLVMYIYSNDDRTDYLFETIISDIFNEVSKQNH